MIKLNNQNTALHIYICLVYLQCGHGEVAELVDATREFGTLLFTGLEIQWLPLYRLEPGLLHEYRFNSYSLTEVAEVISALPFGRFSDRFDSTERRHTGVHIGMLCTQPEVCMPDRYRLRPQSPIFKRCAI